MTSPVTPPVSAIDVISPAFTRAKQQLFSPFRWGFWLRMAVVSFFAGEMGGGGLNFTNFGGFNPPNGGRANRPDHLLNVPWANAHNISQMMPWIITLAFCAVVLLGIFLYLHSVFRFILFDSVLSGSCHIRQGWSQRHAYGLRYLVWILFYTVIFLAVIALVVGVPVFAAWQAGIFNEAKEHIFLLIAGGFFLFLLLLALSLAGAFISILVRDFLVPIVALEDVTIADAWQKFRPVVYSQKGSFAAYFGMKILLALGVAVIVGIVDVLFLLVLLIPAVVAIGIFAVIGVKSAGIIVLAVVMGLAAFLLLLFLFALTSVPGAIFFQSYTFYFLAPRYAPLAERLFPPSPPVMVPEPPPLPSPA